MRGLAQPATIKANSHVANTTPAPPSSQNAIPPLVVLIISGLLRFASSGSRSTADAEVPFRSIAQSARLILGKIGNKMGYMSGIMP